MLGSPAKALNVTIYEEVREEGEVEEYASPGADSGYKATQFLISLAPSGEEIDMVRRRPIVRVECSSEGTNDKRVTLNSWLILLSYLYRLLLRHRLEARKLGKFW